MNIANEEALLSKMMTVFSLARNVLVVAPHPDDEVFGCGGTLSLLQGSGSKVTTIIVTNGALGGDDADGKLFEIRADESRSAATILGLDAPVFWGLLDRGIGYGEVLIERLIESIRETDADLVFLPSPADWHPDHQAIAFAGAEAIRRLGGNRQAAFYEVTDPLPCPNLIHDISAVEGLKRQAMGCFSSQLKEQPYVDRIAGINSFRAFHLGAQVKSAEAFSVLTAADLDKGLSILLDGPLTHRRNLGFASVGSDIPLVSVIIRSMDRPTLIDALNSLALQTYSNIEIILVNALGSEHQKIETRCGRFPLRHIETGERLHRSRAANMGLDSALGDYLIFLDDDDWFESDHIHKLIDGIKLQSKFRVAYSGVKCVDEFKNPIAPKFDSPFEAIRLLADNFIPIHAVLFSRVFLGFGCRFDESMELYEDWDFWIQLLRHGDFLQIGGCSAVYRISQGSGFGVNGNIANAKPARWTLYKKWFNRFSDIQISRLMEIIRQDKVKSNQIHEIAGILAERKGQVDSLTIAIEEFKVQIGSLNIAIDESKVQIGDLTCALEDAANLSSNLNFELAKRDANILDLNRIIAERDTLVASLLGSTSWQLTKPLRFLSRLIRGGARLASGVDAIRAATTIHGKRLYHRLPIRLREPLLSWCYRNLGSIFRGMPHFERWKMSGNQSDTAATGGSAMLLLDTVPEASHVHGRIAIHLHMFYHDLADEFVQYLKNMPFDFDLYISVASEEGLASCQKAFSRLTRKGLLVIEKVPNQGRDISPMFCAFGSRLKDYDYLAHLHSKKSLYNNGATEGWRQYLCVNLLGSEERIRQIFTLLQGDSPRGIVYPQNYSGLPYQANTWLASRGAGMAWCARLGIDRVPQGYFDFPAGSMFWARGHALKPLFDTGITLSDFAEESGQTDGTFAHCLERLLVLSSQKQGYMPGIIKDVQHATWSAWSHHQYAARPFEAMVRQLNNPAIKLVAFDIFDTLLCRPLIDAESIKVIVSERIGGAAGIAYLQYRQAAEGQARVVERRDVGMIEIFTQLGRLTGLPNDVLTQMRLMEEDVERTSVSPRSGGMALYRAALTASKPLVLISDMFLPRAVIEAILKENGISGWGKLYLSNEVGLRKDSGQLYQHVLSQQRVKSSEMLMIGDNERSDWQIPCDLGATGIHLIKPVDFARGLPRFRSLFEANERGWNLNCELTLGLVLRENFSAISYPELDPDSLVSPSPFNIGYSIVGPLLVGFSQWLIDSARNDGVDSLYFLAREGQLMKSVHDIWAEGVCDAPQSNYLVLSRRAVSVPMIQTFDDIVAIAKTTYYQNRIDNFFFERFGLKISADRWDQITRQVQWTCDSKVEIHDQQIDHLFPLLRVVESDIIANGVQEKEALLQYLHSMGLNSAGRQAVIDVGYSATIQDYLNRLMENSVEGYYLMTDQKSSYVSERHDVIIRGCYVENASRENTSSQMYLHSFELEKLLSSSDAQVVRYEWDDANCLVARHRELSNEEKGCASFRSELQSGVMRFARDARNIREHLHPAYLPSRKVAEQIYEAFITKPSQGEIAMMKNVILDDYYCGRGLVA